MYEVESIVGKRINSLTGNYGLIQAYSSTKSSGVTTPKPMRPGCQRKV